MATVALSTSSVTLDPGTAYELTVLNSGTVSCHVQIGGGVGYDERLRPGQQMVVHPNGSAVTAFVRSGAGEVQTTISTNPETASSGGGSFLTTSAAAGTYGKLVGPNTWTGSQDFTGATVSGIGLTVVADATGVAATDSAAIQAAHDALPSAGGEIRLGKGTYVLGSTQLSFTKTTKLIGQGGGWRNLNAPTVITYTGTNTPALTFTGDGHVLRDFAVRYASGSTATSGSAAIHFASGQGVRMSGVSTSGFYNGIEFEGGREWWMDSCYVWAPVNNGLQVRNTGLPDGGDMGVTNCQFVASGTTGVAAVRWESGGGLRFFGNKINAATGWQYGVDMVLASGALTGVMLINGNSIENITRAGVRATTVDGTGGLSQLHIMNNEFLMIGALVDYVIYVYSGVATQINSLVIEGNNLRGPTPALTGKGAIFLSNVDGAKIGPANRYKNFGALLRTDSGCTDIDNRGIRPVTSPFTSADLSTTSTSFVDLNAAFSGTIGASVGDMIRLSLRGAYYPSTATVIQITFTFTRSDGTELNSSQEMSVKTPATALQLDPLTYDAYYTVASTDLSGGTFTAKVQWKVSTGTAQWQKGNLTLENLGPSSRV